MRAFLLLGVVLFSAAICRADALADTKLDAGKLKAQPDREYTLNLYMLAYDRAADPDHAKPNLFLAPGTSSLKLHTDFDGRTLTCADTRVVKLKGAPYSSERVETVTARTGDALTVTKIEASTKRTSRKEATATHYAVTADGSGKASLATPGAAGKPDTQEINFPADTMTMGLLLRLVGHLPREAGKVWTFSAAAPLDEFRSTSMDEGFELYAVKEGKRPYAIKCDGPEKIAIGTNQLECTRYTLDNRMPRHSAATVFWVDKDGVVQQFVNGEGLRATLGDPGAADTDPMRQRLIDLFTSR